MDQHGDVLATDRCREAKLDWQAEREQLLDELNKLIDRLTVMEPEYQELINCAQRNLQDAYVLEEEIDTFVIGLDRPLISRWNL